MEEEQFELVDVNGVGEPLIIDVGNGWCKFLVRNRRGIYQHGGVEVDEATFNRISGEGSGDTLDLIVVYEDRSTRYFVLGETAHKGKAFQLQYGRARYTKYYYGIHCLRAIAEMFAGYEDRLRKLSVHASFASGDSSYSDDLKASVSGPWEFSVGSWKPKKERFHFDVSGVSTYREAGGGVANYKITLDGDHFSSRPELEGAPIACLDFGAYTISSYYVSGNGQPIDDRAYSLPGAGIISVSQDLSARLERHPTIRQLYRNTPPSLETLFGIIRTGYIITNQRFSDSKLNEQFKPVGNTGEMGIDVREIVGSAAVPLVNNALRLWTQYLRSGQDSKILVLTGGGAGAVGYLVTDSVNFSPVAYAAPSEDLQFANVLGRGKTVLIAKILELAAAQSVAAPVRPKRMLESSSKKKSSR